MGRRDGIFCMLRGQPALRLETATEIRRLGRRFGRSWTGVHQRGADHRTDLGAPGVGHLVDMGCTAHVDIRALASLHFVSAAAVSDRGAGSTRASQFAVWNL